jgi:hypothetical protein
MAFQLSPGVLVTEKDLTNIVPAVSTSAGAFAGAFQWGPVEKVTTVESENRLVELFGKPNDTTATSFFTAANFLSYGNNLQVVRAANTLSRNAVANVSGYPLTDLGNVLGVDDAIITSSVLTIKNSDVYEGSYSTGVSAVQGNVLFTAKYPGALGNSLKVSMADANSYAAWTYKSEFDSAPGTSTAAAVYHPTAYDELHIAVIDEDGLFSNGTKGVVLEKFAYVSKASDAKKSDGTNLYYKDVINQSSKYVWWGSHHVGITNAGQPVSSGTTTGYFGNLSSAATMSLTGGSDLTLTSSHKNTAWALFANDEEIDISLIPTADADSTVADYIRSSVVEVRKDCVMFVSPELADVVGTTSTSTAVTNAIDHRNTNLNFNTSYAVMDSGWKYQYDRYNDVYRWIPLNGDTAGLCARTDFTNDPWFSPAGFNRGVIKNVVKLAYSPTKAQRDDLYKAGVNPVVSFPGQGTVLFGDKTMLTKPSAFDRINVRRLFIVLEKAIATAAKFQLFEFNDAFTRAQFRNLVEPFLRDVQGRRGITDFKVVCDETNNTGEVIDRNEFVADIYIKPARSINFISLNFIATRTGISFEEVGA